MNAKRIKVLIVNDDRDDFHLVGRMLEAATQRTFDVVCAPSFEMAVEELRNPYDVSVLDFKIGKYTGMEFLYEAKNVGCKFPLIILTCVTDSSIDEQDVA